MKTTDCSVRRDTNRIKTLSRQSQDLSCALDVAFSPFETGRRKSLARSERQMCEAEVVELVERAKLLDLELSRAKSARSGKLGPASLAHQAAAARATAKAREKFLKQATSS